MPTFTVTYASDMNEGATASSSEDLKGAEPPALDGLEISSETAEADIDLMDAGPPALPGTAAAIETEPGAELGDAGPPSVNALPSIDEPDESGPPPIESLA